MRFKEEGDRVISMALTDHEEQTADEEEAETAPVSPNETTEPSAPEAPVQE